MSRASAGTDPGQQRTPTHARTHAHTHTHTHTSTHTHTHFRWSRSRIARKPGPRPSDRNVWESCGGRWCGSGLKMKTVLEMEKVEQSKRPRQDIFITQSSQGLPMRARCLHIAHVLTVTEAITQISTAAIKCQNTQGRRAYYIVSRYMYSRTPATRLPLRRGPTAQTAPLLGCGSYYP